MEATLQDLKPAWEPYSGPNQGSGLPVLLSVLRRIWKCLPSDVMSDGVPVLHQKQGFTLWPQTIQSLWYWEGSSVVPLASARQA